MTTDLLNVRNLTRPWFQVKKKNSAKKSVNFINNFFWQIVVISKLNTNVHISQIPFKYIVSPLLTLKNNFCLSFPWTFVHKKVVIKRAKKNCNKIICLEHQIYAIQENFTKSLVVMVETFRRSEWQEHFDRKVAKKLTDLVGGLSLSLR